MVFFPVKILRAGGGCLGARSRRRTWTAAISPGEVLNNLRPGDLRMGEPTCGNAHVPVPEHIGHEEASWGTDTS